jgi:E1A-binding protein p400
MHYIDDTFRDDESTIEEEEKLFTANSKTVDDELEKLRKESELPLDDLLKDYHLDSNYFLGGGKEQQQEPVAADQASTSNTATNTQESEEESGESEEETTEDEEEEEEDEDESMEEESAANEGGLERLLDTDNKEGGEAKKTETVDEDSALASIAQQAQSLQPTGYTLETTHVTTPLPTLLLKHTLREYQHVGLDWLVTMYENKLNGIV